MTGVATHEAVQGLAYKLGDRIAALEEIVGRQAAAIARLESGVRPPRVADPLRGLSTLRRRLLERTIALVAAAFHVDPEEIICPLRDARGVQARFAAVWLFRQLSGLSLTRIGEVFERDHTSISHALRRAEGWRDADPDFAAVTDRLLDQLRTERAGWRP